MKKVAAFKTALKLKRILIILCVFITSLSGFTQSIITIDGVNTTFSNGLSLPYWLKEGQSVGLVSNVKSISIIEFTADANNLTFSRVISLTSPQTVPAGKVWKIEAFGLGISGQTAAGFSNSTIPTIFTSPKTFASAGTYAWIVPPGITNICIEVWGGGGGGGAWGGAGGGGGGYGYACFSVMPGTSYTIIVGNGGLANCCAPTCGNGGAGGTTSVGSLISATGGNVVSVNGGTSSASYTISGNSGSGSNGGAGANGGAGGTTAGPGNPGVSPGGGGAASNNGSSVCGGAGGAGKVIIYW